VDNCLCLIFVGLSRIYVGQNPAQAFYPYGGHVPATKTSPQSPGFALHKCPNTLCIRVLPYINRRCLGVHGLMDKKFRVLSYEIPIANDTGKVSGIMALKGCRHG
jgi:hypothetical protein